MKADKKYLANCCVGGAVHSTDLDLALHLSGQLLVLWLQVLAVPTPWRIKFHKPTAKEHLK